MTLDLNCDLGEGEPGGRTRALMRWIDSANIACGGHAGDVASMRRCLRLAKAHHVNAGAHPGPWNRSDFGRGATALSPDELELLLLHQVGTLERLARTEGVSLHHIKLHGALYHATEANETLAQRYLQTASRWWPRCLLYVLAGGLVHRLSTRTGLMKARIWPEAFADRAYRADGTLVPRGSPGALLEDPRQVQNRLRLLRQRGVIESESGNWIHLEPRTICLHADTPTAPRLARMLAGIVSVRA